MNERKSHTRINPLGVAILLADGISSPLGVDDAEVAGDQLGSRSGAGDESVDESHLDGGFSTMDLE